MELQLPLPRVVPLCSELPTQMSMWVPEPLCFLLNLCSSPKDGALTSSLQGAGVRGGLCISPDWPGWGLLLMVVSALNAEAAG